MIINSNPVKGMRDLSPKEVELRSYVIHQILKVYKKYGFNQIETPCTENIELLSSGDGGDNEKMLFKILKRGEKLKISNDQSENDLVDLGLRYDLTVPLCRFFANKRSKLPKEFKVIQTGSVWRAERPQKGRYRQFTQCDIDVIGLNSILAEIELILATSEALLEIGFSNFKVRINDRRILESLAKQSGFESADFTKVFIILDKIDKIGLEGVRLELEKSNFSNNCINSFMAIVTEATKSGITVDSLKTMLPNISQEVLDDLSKVIDTVKLQADDKYKIVLDLSLVRGMGYYTGQIFEIEADGFGSSIAGGGRYDRMIGKFLKGNEDIPACGFSIGFERVIAILEDQNFKVPSTKNKTAILYNRNDDYNLLCSSAQQLRTQGNHVSLELKNKNLKKQLDNLKEHGFNSFAFFENQIELVVKELN